jgi:hypothetical protein
MIDKRLAEAILFENNRGNEIEFENPSVSWKSNVFQFLIIDYIVRQVSMKISRKNAFGETIWAEGKTAISLPFDPIFSMVPECLKIMGDSLIKKEMDSYYKKKVLDVLGG